MILRVKISISVSSRDIVLRHLSLSLQQNLIDSQTSLLIDTSYTTIQLNLDDTTLAITSNILSSVQSFLSNLSQYRSVMGNSQSITQLSSIRRTEVIVCNKFIEVKNQSVSSQHTINLNDTLILLNVLTQVIKVLTSLEIMCLSATEHRELCGLTASNGTLHYSTSSYRSTLKCSQSFTTEYLECQCQLVSVSSSLAINRHRICNSYISHNLISPFHKVFIDHKHKFNNNNNLRK